VQDTLVIDAMRWHQICYELKLDEYDGADNRKTAFEDYFNCTVTWKSRLDQWSGEDVSERPNPVMLLRFLNPSDAVIFALRWS
jgi:hypothetical protein